MLAGISRGSRMHDRRNEELLYRAIENVVRNAIRYTESGSEVEIRLKRGLCADMKQAEIEVSDRGPGIPESQLSAIFRPFYRVDDARSPDTGGFGVGLAIAERAVRLHHGELSAMNSKGGGATIRITLPADDTNARGAASGLQRTRTRGGRHFWRIRRFAQVFQPVLRLLRKRLRLRGAWPGRCHILPANAREWRLQW